MVGNVDTAKQLVLTGQIKQDEAQKRLTKKYPGLAPVFQSAGKDWFNIILEAISGSEEE